MNDNVKLLNTKIEVGSVVATALTRNKATVMKIIDEKTMVVRWHDDGETTASLRIGFVLV